MKLKALILAGVVGLSGGCAALTPDQVQRELAALSGDLAVLETTFEGTEHEQDIARIKEVVDVVLVAWKAHLAGEEEVDVIAAIGVALDLLVYYSQEIEDEDRRETFALTVAAARIVLGRIEVYLIEEIPESG